MSKISVIITCGGEEILNSKMWDASSYFGEFFFFLMYLAAQGLSRGMRDLVPWPGIEPRPPALEAQSLNCWATMEVPGGFFLKLLLLLWVELCLQPPAPPKKKKKKIRWSLNSRTLECDIIWKQDLYRSQVKMRSWVWAVIQCGWVLIKGGK